MPRSRSTASRAIRPRRRPSASTAPVAVRIHEAVGSSRRGWDDAVLNAVRGAKSEAPDPIAVEIGRLWADLDGARAISLYRASVKIAYRQAITPPAREIATRKTTRKRVART